MKLQMGEYFTNWFLLEKRGFLSIGCATVSLCQTMPQRDDRGLRSIGYSKFRENRADIITNRSLG